MNSLTFVDGINHFKQDNINIHSLLVIRNNQIVLDAYFYPFRKNYVHDLASVTKSVTSLLIGIAIDKGYIENEYQRMLKYFLEYTTQSETLKTLRIRDLLNMVSGLQCSWDDGEKELMQMRNSDDWVKFKFSLPFETIPGKKFSYCSGNFYLLAEILQRATKMTCLDFADGYKEEHPMGMSDQYIISSERAFGLPIALKCSWESNKLIIYYNELCKINLYTFTFTFTENDVDFEYQDKTNDLNFNFKGEF